MFEKFGELNSFGEINELAENLFNEGDTESLRRKFPVLPITKKKQENSL